MFFTFTGVRRPRVERARPSRVLLGGVLLASILGSCATSRPAGVGKGSIFTPVLPPIPAGGAKLPVWPAPRARYAGRATATESVRSSFVAPSDSVRADTLVLRRFEAGRLAAYAASPLLFHPRHQLAVLPAPPLPASLRPADPAQARRAAAAYSLGYARQLAYAPPSKHPSVSTTWTDADEGRLLLGIPATAGLVVLICLAVSVVLNAAFAPFSGFFGSP